MKKIKRIKTLTDGSINMYYEPIFIENTFILKYDYKSIFINQKKKSKIFTNSDEFNFYKKKHTFSKNSAFWSIAKRQGSRF